uniref:Ciliary neurotrophic factor receptor subunit alpha n=1 Tax=Anas platyrhynchos platyrhynchos TaxID=8840 RepID=A0A493TF90_ANAPP
MCFIIPVSTLFCCCHAPGKLNTSDQRHVNTASKQMPSSPAKSAELSLSKPHLPFPHVHLLPLLLRGSRELPWWQWDCLSSCPASVAPGCHCGAGDSLYPPLETDSHIQYERVGADVTMKCGSMDWDAAVTWTANGTDIDDSHLNGSYLILKNVDLTQSGQYSCYEGSSWHLKYQTYLRVGTPPKEPVLMCRSNNYPKGFYCSWHLPSPTYIPNSFNISVIHGTREMVCEKDIFPKNRCHIRYLQLFSTVKYKVTLTVTNALGKNSTSLTFDEFAIVKPDPPESVVAKPVPNNPRRLEVAWQNPSSWPDPESFPLKFFLRYRPLILDQWQHVELSDGTSHTITDAYAGKEYIIQVAAKDNDIGTWSDWSVAVHATPWTEEPKHLTTEAQITETTSTSTSSFVPPPTTKICDKGAVVGSGAVAVCWTAGLVLAAYGVLFI